MGEFDRDDYERLEAKSDKPADLPKVKSAVPPQWLYELHFKCIDGHVFLVIHPPGKPQFPIHNGVVYQPQLAAAEFATALEESKR